MTGGAVDDQSWGERAMSTGRTLAQMCGKAELYAVEPGSTVAHAARTMRDHGIGAVLVSEGGRLDGIISERDVTYRAVAAGLDPNATQVADVMTRQVLTAHPETRALNGLQLMAENQIRHLPVVDGGNVVGIVSLRDFLAEELAQVQDEISFEGAIAEELW
jgi:CBS domain-containing protein